MRLLTLAFPCARSFLASYSDAYPEGAVFCGTRTELGLDERVLVEIDFPELPNRALMRGQVGALVVGAGAWVRISREDRSTREFLVRVARGDLSITERVPRSHRRFPADLPVNCRIEEPDEAGPEALTTRTHDLGAGGAFIRSTTPPRVGTRIRLVIGPTLDSSEIFQMYGRVAWIQRGRGFGVCFDHHGEHDAGRLRALLRRTSETGRLLFAA